MLATFKYKAVEIGGGARKPLVLVTRWCPIDVWKTRMSKNRMLLTQNHQHFNFLNIEAVRMCFIR